MQSHRVVTLLARRRDEYRGLNLNIETIDAIQRKKGDYPNFAPKIHSSSEDRGMSLEAQLLDVTDDIAYVATDTADGIRNRFLSEDEVAKSDLIRMVKERVGNTVSGVRSALIYSLKDDVTRSTLKTLRDGKVRNLSDVYSCSEKVVDFSKGVRENFDVYKRYLNENMWQSLSKKPYEKAVRELIFALCEYVYNSGFARSMRDIAEENGDIKPKARATLDFVSKLTDKQAIKMVADLELVPKTTIMQVTEPLQGI